MLYGQILPGDSSQEGEVSAVSDSNDHCRSPVLWASMARFV